MPNSVVIARGGPFQPLGSIAVATPGTPVRLTSLIDASNLNAPGTPTSQAGGHSEYSELRCQQISISGFKPGAAHGLQANAGTIYILLDAAGAGSGNRDDPGVMLFPVLPQQTIIISTGATQRNAFSPYELLVDADNAGDCAQVSLIIG